MDPTIVSALWGTEGLAGLQGMLQQLDAQETVSHALASLLVNSDWLISCRFHRVKFKPDRKLTVYYNAVIEIPGAAPMTRALVVVWRPEGDATKNEFTPEMATMEAEAAEHRLLAPFTQLAAVWPEWGMQIQIAPLDPEFPQLVRVSDPEYVRTMIEAVGSATDGALVDKRVPAYNVTAIRYRPGQRHVLCYEPTDAVRQDPRTLFAKLYEDAQECERAFGVASRVADWLSLYGNGLSALRPCGYSAEDAIILYPRLVGEPLSDRFNGPLNEVQPYLQHAGSVLRTLHRRPDEIAEEFANVSTQAAALMNNLKPHSFAKEIKAIARTCEHIDVFLPEVGAQIHSLLERAQTLCNRLPPEAPTFAHGDYKADHLWITNDGLTLMDFDTCYLADPAIDVGKFLSDLHWWSAIYERDDIAALREAFLDAYGVDVPAARLQRAQIYEALVLVKSTAHRVRLFDPAWAMQTTNLINRADQIIQGAAEI